MASVDIGSFPFLDGDVVGGPGQCGVREWPHPKGLFDCTWVGPGAFPDSTAPRTSPGGEMSFHLRGHGKMFPPVT